MSGVKVRVTDGYGVFDGKRLVTSGEVTVDEAEAERLVASGAAEKLTAAKPPAEKAAAADSAGDGRTRRSPKR